ERAVEQAHARGLGVDGSSRRRRHEGGGRQNGCQEPEAHAALERLRGLEVAARLAAARTRGAAAETLDATTGVDELLAARVEGVAVRADLDVKLRLRRPRPELVAARAAHVGRDVLGMNICLHYLSESSDLAPKWRPNQARNRTHQVLG